MAGTASPQIQSVELVYAAALLDLAEESGQVDAMTDEVAQFGALISEPTGLVKLLESKALSIEERAKVLERIFKGRISDLLYRFLQVVNAKDRLAAVPGIVMGFKRLQQERHGVVEVDAFVARQLDATQEALVAQRLGSALNRKVLIRQHVDADLIGGLKLRIGDEIVDGSVLTQLKIVREKMIAAGRVKATALAANA